MRVQIHFDEPSLTVQGFKDQCDLRVLKSRFGRVADFSDFVNSYRNPSSGSYGDFSDIPDYQSALDRIREADSSFLALPAHVRARFRNDPASFLQFFSDPANVGEARSLGLLKPVENPVSEASVEVKKEGA
jgi:phage internal scaffolding protein